MIRSLYEYASYGLPPLYHGRPKYWYERAASTGQACERLTEMAIAQLEVAELDDKTTSDILLLLEQVEELDSIDLIKKILLFHPTSPFDPPARLIPLADTEMATPKQRNFLKQLGILNFHGTKAEASKKIDQILAERELTR